MVHVSDDIYKHIAEFLHTQSTYWSGRIRGDYWVFNITIVIYNNDLAPVWYEFITDDQDNDFSFDKLKEFYKQ